MLSEELQVLFRFLILAIATPACDFNIWLEPLMNSSNSDFSVFVSLSNFSILSVLLRAILVTLLIASFISGSWAELVVLLYYR